MWAISYSVSGMTDWLYRNQFSYKKPSLVPGKANLEAQKAWISSYEQLRQNLGNDETICFVDGVHPTHKLFYGWIRKGVRKEIWSYTGRQRINLLGALDVFEGYIFEKITCWMQKQQSVFTKDRESLAHYLPPYSPNLNPIERLWKWMKQRVHNTYYECFDDFKQAVFGFWRAFPDSILNRN